MPRLVGQTAESRMRKSIIKTKLNETTFFEHLDKVEAGFYRKLLDFAKNNQLLIIWTPMSFSLNIVRGEDDIIILRGYCNLSSFGQTLFTTVGNISSKVPNGESIVNEYKKGLENIGKKAADGYSFNIAKIDEEQSARFYEVLTSIIKMIKSSR